MKNKLQYVCVQPYTLYYSWQVDVMLDNFIENGIEAVDIHILLAYDSEVDTKTYYVWNKVIEKYKSVNFYFYSDLRTNKNYVSSIRPNVLSQFYKEYPEFNNIPVFYYDCDICFTKPFDYSNLLNDDVWYLSDTNSYINYDYIKHKPYGEYEKMCEIVGIDDSIPKENNNNSGGAQYIIKNVDWNFWKTVEDSSERLFTEMTEFNKIIKEKNPYHHELQIWCADMWALLWEAWKIGYKTKVIPEMDFCWSTDDIKRWDECTIYHNAGVTSDRTDMFNKTEYQTILPYNIDLSKINKGYCNYKYAEKVKQL